MNDDVSFRYKSGTSHSTRRQGNLLGKNSNGYNNDQRKFESKMTFFLLKSFSFIQV